MIGTEARTLSPGDLQSAAEALLGAGGRVRFAYAWSPAEGQVDVRYIASVPDRRDFEMWVVKSARELPSLAEIFPSLGWYEREMMDLNGLRFTDHPEPYPLVLKDSGQELMNAVPAASGRVRLPDIDAVDVQLLPFGPIRADVLESAEFTFVYVGEHIIHYQPRLFFKHRGMESCFQGADPGRAVITAERVSAVGSVGHALSYCEAVERAANCNVPARAKALRVLLAEMERIYNHLHYLGHLCHTTTLKVGEAQGKLLEEKAKQLNARLTGSRFLRSLARPGRPAPRPRPRAMAWRRPREPARGGRDLCRASSRTPRVISIA